MRAYYMDSRHRDELIQKIKKENFDLIIIGGGITGASILLDAVSRGLNALLIERNDFSSGNSSKSNKFVHGPLESWKDIDFRHLFKIGKQRKIIHRLARHLFVPKEMMIPITTYGSLNQKQIKRALWFYDLFANIFFLNKYKILNPKKAMWQERYLEEDDLLGAAMYRAYMGDDTRLGIELIKTAARIYNGLAVNHMEAASFIYDGKKIIGVNVRETLKDETFQLRAKVVVAACGVWNEEVKKLDHFSSVKKQTFAKNVQVVIPIRKFKLDQVVNIEAEDGRRVLGVPSNRVTYIGGIDYKYDGNKEHIPIKVSEAEYLLNACNRYFPFVDMKLHHIVSSWSGLTPIINEQSKSPYKLPKKDEVEISSSGLMIVSGVHIAKYRVAAKRTVNKILKRLKKKRVPTKTKKLPITVETFKIFMDYKDKLFDAKNSSKFNGLSEDFAEYLIHNYGKIGRYIPFMGTFEHFNPEVRLTINETYHCLKYENIQTLCDFFIRRSGRIYFDIDSIRMVRVHVAQLMAKELNWNRDRMRKEHDELDAEIEKVTRFIID